jgi:hypothetical protein
MLSMIDKYSFAIASLELLFFPFLIYACTTTLRRNHAAEIYVIWYLNSFFFVLFFGMGVIAEKKNKRLEEVCGAYESTCKTIYDYLTNIVDEVIIVAVFTGLALLPQILTYLLSGVYGIASTPKFASQIQKIAVWSLVKFLAGLGGIISAAPMAKWVTGKPAPFIEFTTGLGLVAIAFAYASLHVDITKWLAKQRKRVKSEEKHPLLRLHRFFTRHSQNSEEGS